MKKVLVVILSFFVYNHSFSQTSNRKGFFFGTSIGPSFLHLNYSETKDQQICGSFPNFKFGYQLTSNSALTLVLPGSVYKYSLTGRSRDRGYEGILLGYQRWAGNKVWYALNAGTTMDAPAFYDIKNETERKFHFGYGIALSSGYEFVQREKFTLDLQFRAHVGRINRGTESYTGSAFNFLIGFNWL